MKTCPRVRLLLPVALLMIAAGCSKKGAENASSNSPPSPGQRVERAAGVAWTMPAGWVRQPDRPFRVATYRIAAGSGDTEDAECAVYFFGSGQGGSVEANLSRWANQFEQPDGRSPGEVAEEHKLTIAGLSVYTLKTSGTYTAAGSPMAASGEKKPHFAMLGAIVEAPQGLTFCKLLGPEKTVEAAQRAFDAMLQSLRLQPTT